MRLNTKGIGFGVFFVLGLIVGILKPFSPELSALGHKIVTVLIITVGLWIFKPRDISFSVSGAFFMAFCLLFGVPASKVFAGFTSPALWILIPALFFGFVLAKTGLGKRVAYFVIKLFRPSYIGMTLAWVLIGIILSVMTPSIIVRIAIVMPIAISCVEICKLEYKSKGAALILLTAWGMALLPGGGWLTGSLWGPIILGMFNSVPELNGMITFSSWFKFSFLPIELTALIVIIMGYMLLKPAEDIGISKQQFVEEYSKLGPWTLHEKLSAAILIAAFVFFATNQIHHIPDAAVGLVALFLLSVCGIINGKEISSGINWDLVIFIGIAMGLAPIFGSSGVSAWLNSVLIPIVQPFTGNMWVFVFGMAFILFAWRFIDVAILIPTMAILIPVLPRLLTTFNINPMVWTALFVLTGNCFFLSYQNVFSLIGSGLAGEKSWTPKQHNQYGLIYFIACLISLVITIAYWKVTGLTS